MAEEGPAEALSAEEDSPASTLPYLPARHQ